MYCTAPTFIITLVAVVFMSSRNRAHKTVSDVLMAQPFENSADGTGPQTAVSVDADSFPQSSYGHCCTASKC